MLGYHDFLDGLTRGVAAHHAGMLPTFKECVEELFAQRPVQGRLRDRDAGARHQHAGPLGGDREAVEVERRDPRRHHAGGVHPAHRPRRPPRHRRRGPRGRAVAAGLRPEGGRRPGLDPHLPAQVVVPAVVQHGGQPGPPGRPRRPPASCWSRRSRSSRPTRRSSGWPGSCARPRTRWRATPRRPPATSATSWSTPRCASGSPTPRPPRPGTAGPTGATQVIASLEALRPGDVIEVPGGKFAGMAVVIDPGTTRGPGGATALRADRRPARAPAVDGRLPGAGGGVHPDADPAQLQRPQPAVAPRPRLDAAGPHPGLHPAAPHAASAAAAGSRDRQELEGERQISRLRAELRAHPCHGCSDREDHARWAERHHKLERDTRTLQAPDRAAHEHHRAAVRPGLRGAHLAGLPRRRRGHRARAAR